MTTNPQGPARRPGDPDAYPVLTALMLMLGGFVLPFVGWLAGVVMLWSGRAWSTSEKWLGTLAWPAVVALPVAFVGAGALLGLPYSHWLVIAGVVSGLAGVVVVLPYTFIRIMRAGRV